MPAACPVQIGLRLALDSCLRPGLRFALLASAALLLSAPAQATTLVRCKIDGKTVYSDTDCPRSTRLKNDLPASKPIRISRKSKAAKSR